MIVPKRRVSRSVCIRPRCTRPSTSRPAAAAFAWRRSSMSGALSTPSMSMPWARKSRRILPVPVPTSSTGSPRRAMTSRNQSRSSHPEVSPRRASHASAMRPTYSMSSGIAVSVGRVPRLGCTSSAAPLRHLPHPRAHRPSPARERRTRHDRVVTASTATATPAVVPARTAELFAPGLRGLSIGLIATITLVALEALAIGTVLPMVGEELGQIELYGWVYSAFFLGNLLGVVVAGGALDRVPLWRPFADRAGAVRGRADDRWAGAVDGDPRRGTVRPGAGRRRGRARPRTWPSAARCPQRLQPRMFALLSTAWVVPGRGRAVDRGDRRRVHDVAPGVPGPAAAARRRRRDRRDRAPPDPGRGAAGGARGRRRDGPAPAQRAAGGGRRRAPGRRAHHPAAGVRDRRRGRRPRRSSSRPSGASPRRARSSSRPASRPRSCCAA